MARKSWLYTLGNYLLATGIVGVALLLRWGVLAPLGMHTPYLLVYPAVLFSAFLLGIGPGLLAATLGIALTELLVVFPAYAWHSSPEYLLRIPVVALSGLAMGYAGSLLRRSQAQVIRRAEAEHALHEIALQTANAFTFDWNPVTDVVVRSAHCAAILGLLPGGATCETSASFFQRIEPDDREAFQRLLQRLTPATPAYHTEYRIRRPDGQLICLEESARGFFDERGRLVRLVGFTSDVTQRRAAERQLRETSQRLQFHIENSPLAVIEFDSQLRVRYWSDAATKIFGWTAPEVIGCNMWDLPWVHEEDRPQIKAISEQLVRGTVARNVSPNRNYRKDGGAIYCEWYNSTLLDTMGRMNSVLSLVLDVTRRVEAESALRDAEARFRTLADSIPQLAWIARADGSTTWYNRRWYEYTGTTFEQMQGWGWQAVHDPAHVERVTARFKACVEAGAAWEDTFPLRGRDGTYRWFLSRALPLHDDQGRVVQWFGTNTDITERLVAAEELRRAKESAEAANLAKDEFLAALSHELRTPLTPVLLTASLLGSRADVPPALREDLETIRRNVQLEARLIDDLLDLTRIARGKLRFSFQSVDAHVLIRSAADICGHGDGAPITLELAAEASWVTADAGRLQQVFWNLLSNARKFTPRDGQIVVCTRSPTPERLEVEVRDTGCGMDAEFLPRAFNAFEQGFTDGTRPTGLGLGLAICKAIVEAHQGVISAASAGRGRGSTLRVELPTVPAVRDVGPSHQCAPAQPQAKPLRVLLVEDHESTRQVMRKLITSLGHRVESAGTIREAMVIAAQESFDLVVSDVGLPDGSGNELMQQLSRRYGLSGIALSGYGMEEDVRRSLESGFAMHLTKPVDMEQLHRALAQITKCANMS